MCVYTINMTVIMNLPKHILKGNKSWQPTSRFLVFFFFFPLVGKLFITSVKHTCSERTTRFLCNIALYISWCFARRNPVLLFLPHDCVETYGESSNWDSWKGCMTIFRV